MFIGLLTGLVNGSNHTKCVPLSNQKCEIQPTLINLHPNEYSQELDYYSFTVKLDRCIRSCNTLNDLSNKVCVPKKIEDLNLNMLNMITGINESTILTKDTSCECKCRFDGKKCNSYQWWNNNKCRCECKKRHVCEKDLMKRKQSVKCKISTFYLIDSCYYLLLFDKISSKIKNIYYHFT